MTALAEANLLDDEQLASGCAAGLLISALTLMDAETIARRVHYASRGAGLFVRIESATLPTQIETLRAACTECVAAANGGTLFLCGVDEMPGQVQNALWGVLAELQTARTGLKVRLVAGTTVSLFERTLDGRFDAHLFYRLNTIHLVSRRRAT